MSGKVLKILPSVPMSAFFGLETFTLRVERATLDDIRRDAQDAVVINYIRHPPTVQIISSVVPNLKQEAEAKLNIGEEFYVVSLPSRQAKPGEDVEVKQEDLLVYKCRVLP